MMLFTVNTAKAQFESENLSFGAGLGYTGYGSVGKNLTFNLRGNYNFDEANSIALSYNYMLPLKETLTDFASPNSSGTPGSGIDVNVEQNIVFHNLALDYHLYFVADNEESFGVYGLGGIGLTIANISYEIGSYDASKYNGPTESEYPEASYQGLILNLGLGSNFNLSDKVALFGEFKIGLPANRANDAVIANPIPFNFSLFAGARYNLFN